MVYFTLDTCCLCINLTKPNKSVKPCQNITDVTSQHVYYQNDTQYLRIYYAIHSMKQTQLIIFNESVQKIIFVLIFKSFSRTRNNENASFKYTLLVYNITTQFSQPPCLLQRKSNEASHMQQALILYIFFSLYIFSK